MAHSSIPMTLAGLLILSASCADIEATIGPDASLDTRADPADPNGSGDPDDRGESGGPGEPDDPGEVHDPTASFACPDDAPAIAEGENIMVVDGLERSFYADFPADLSQPMGIVFSWHGFGDNATNFRNLGLDPDGDPDLPVVVITPADSGLGPFGDPQGLGWDIRSGQPDYENVDFAFFESMVACLKEDYPVDHTRIASYGFSAGAVMTSLLHTRYPDVFSAIIAESGVWMNDPEQTRLVNFISVDWQWPALDPSDGGVVLLSHGGPRDTINILGLFNIIDIHQAAQATPPFLTDSGRFVIDCIHDGGHRLHPDFRPQFISEFLAAHRAGEPSPYLDGGAGSVPASCDLLPPAP